MAAPQSVHDDPDSGQDCGACRYSDTGSHSMRLMGSVRRREGSRLDCSSPVLRVCRRGQWTEQLVVIDGQQKWRPVWTGCQYEQRLPCRRARESICRPCAFRYRRRVRRIAKSGLGREGFYEYFLTLTSPGDRLHCKRPGCKWAPNCGHEICACTEAGGVDLGVWNAEHGPRWNHFRTRLKQDHPSIEYMRGCEVQDGAHTDGIGRGALHDHIVFRSLTEVTEAELRKIALDAGFGHSVKLLPIRPGSTQEAYYVSKYLTKSADSRAEVPWVDLVTGEVVPGRYRTWSCSQKWGDSMTVIRQAAHDLYLALEAERLNAMGVSAMSVLVAGFGGEMIMENSRGSAAPT